jgi:hypothetical protein
MKNRRENPEISEKKSETQVSESRWAIATDWFPLNQRSAWVIIKDYLCPACAKRLNLKKEPPLNNLLTSIESCCSQSPDFINEKMPLLESAFRLLLRNGNRPMTLQQLSIELGQIRLGDIYRTAPETLRRILKNDRFYGLQEISG